MLETILIFIKRSGMAVLTAALVVGACSAAGDIDETTTITSASPEAPDADPPSDLTILATTSIAGDLVAQVVGDLATVEVLMPIGADPHDFQPSSRDAARLRQADLVVAWGLGLEEGLEDVLAAAVTDGVLVVELSALVDPIAYGDAGDLDHDDDHDDDHADHDDDHADHDDDHADHRHGEFDPHVWMDPLRMAEAARLLGSLLTDIDPIADWTSMAEAAAAEYEQVHADIEQILSVIPDEQRKFVTNHDSLRYFAVRYDFEVVGVAIPGGSTMAAPSSGQIAALVDTIRRTGVTVLVAETINPGGLLDAIAGEAEGVSVVEILTDSLAEPGTPGDTLAGMLRHNATVLAAALTS
jgi:zinc/manganese transport system substrate-binding protein